MYVRLLAHFENHMAELHDIFVHVACGCGSVLLWQRCRKLCTSGFVDYVMFLYIGLYGASRVFLSAESVRGEITASIWGRLCSTIQIRNCTSMIAHRGAVCHLRLPYWCTLPVAVARSSSDSVAIRYVLPVSLMTSWIYSVGSMVRHVVCSPKMRVHRVA